MVARVFLFVAYLLLLFLQFTALLQCNRRSAQVDKKPDTSKKQNAIKKQQAPQQTVQQAQLADKDILANTNELNMSSEPSGANQTLDAANNNNETTGPPKSDDSFDEHKPVVKNAKRAKEIEEKGPVSKDRNDYKTLRSLKTDPSTFDQTL